MAQDIEAGRETEFEAMTGYVVRKAKELGVPVPITALVRCNRRGWPLRLPLPWRRMKSIRRQAPFLFDV
jgi:ketopantoate reductase PanE/ApbA-like protein